MDKSEYTPNMGIDVDNTIDSLMGYDAYREEQIRKEILEQPIDIGAADKKDPTFARRFNEGKVRFDLVDPEFEEGVARVLTFGANKYGEDNWKASYHTENHREFVTGCHASIRRHLHSIRSGEWLDSESGLPHIDHISCNAMFIRYYEHG